MHDPIGVAWTYGGLALAVAWIVFHLRGKELAARLGISKTAALCSLVALSLGWLIVIAIGKAVGF